MNNVTDKSKATPFLERHNFTSMFLTFCLGLQVCLVTTSNIEKAAHGKTLSPILADMLDMAPEPTDSLTLERFLSGSAVHDSHRVGCHGCLGIPSSTCKVVVTPVARDSLTSLRVRLQI